MELQFVSYTVYKLHLITIIIINSRWMIFIAFKLRTGDVRAILTSQFLGHFQQWPLYEDFNWNSGMDK